MITPRITLFDERNQLNNLVGQKYVISHVVLTCKLIKLTAEDESEKLLLAAKKVRRATSTDFVISLVGDDFSRASSAYVGKLRQVLSDVVATYPFASLLLSYPLTFIDKFFTGLIFWVRSSPYMIANLHVKPPFN